MVDFKQQCSNCGSYDIYETGIKFELLSDASHQGDTWACKICDHFFDVLSNGEYHGIPKKILSGNKGIINKLPSDSE